MRRASAALAVLASVACHPRVAHVRPAPMSEQESELLVYAQPLPLDAARLSFGIASVAVLAVDGTLVPLELAAERLSGVEPRAQRLLARGRIPPGPYAALEVRVRDASLAGGDRPVALLVPEEPARAPAAFTAAARKATVLWLELSRASAAPVRGFSFAPELSASTPPWPVVKLFGACSSPDLDRLTVFDRRRREVVAAVATGRGPQGIAVDERSARAFVALSGDDEVQVVDLATGEPSGRIRLAPGDAPRDVALTPDGRMLVAANAGSGTASFLDPTALEEVGRVPTGDDPGAVLVDRGGRRAYVLNRRSGTITVLDVGNRTAVATVATEAEPVRAQLDRAGDRLYVVHAASPFMTVVSLRELAVRERVFVGFGATAVQVDPRTDLVYVAREGESRLQIFHPFSLVQIDSIPLPGTASALAIDDAENALLAAMPGGRVGFVDLTSRKALSIVDVGDEPRDVALVRERF